MNRTNSRKDSNKQQKAENARINSSLNSMTKLLKQIKTSETSSKKKKPRKATASRPSANYHPVIDSFAHPHDAAPGQYIPSMPPLSTQKFTCHQAFEMTVGTAGFGFVGFRPQFCNDRDSLVYSTATFAGSTLASGITNALVVGVGGIPISSFPYSWATIASNNGSLGADSLYRPRIVSFGANITYTGKALDRSGSIYSLVSTTGEDVSNRTLSQIIANPASMRYSVNDMEQAYVTLHGTLREHYNLQNPEVTGTACFPDSANLPNRLYYDYTGSGTSASVPCVGVLIVNGVPGTTFNVDIIAHFEVGGEGPGCLLTPCYCDEAALSQANNVSKISQSLHKANPHTTKSNIAQAAISLGMGAGGSIMSGEGAKLKKKGGMYAVAGEGLQLGGGLMKNKGMQRSLSKMFKF